MGRNSRDENDRETFWQRQVAKEVKEERGAGAGDGGEGSERTGRMRGSVVDESSCSRVARAGSEVDAETVGAGWEVDTETAAGTLHAVGRRSC